MKTINLYFDFEFTSLSPDAQPISVGIVSDEYLSDVKFGEETVFGGQVQSESNAKHINNPKSLYAEFTDFDIERCDDWVRKNVVSKLKYNKAGIAFERDELRNGNVHVKDNTDGIKQHLKGWLKHFSGYQIQMVCDCGTWDWYWMLQLLAEWDIKGVQSKADMGFIPTFKTGLPVLPINISPVPFDLNDLIAIKHSITPLEAFNVNREFEWSPNIEVSDQLEFWGKSGKHNALWDAKVIKEIYNKLK